MTLDRAILEEVREGSRELWRRFRRDLGPIILLLAAVFLGFNFGVCWLLGPAWGERISFAVVRRTGGILTLPIALLAGTALAFLRVLKAVVVDGALLARLGGLLLAAPFGPGLPPAADQFAAFASPGLLAKAARIRDLPLLLFLMRAILGLELAPFLTKAQTGAGREGIVEDLVQAVRAAAGRNLRRCRGALWLSVALALALPLLVGWLLR